MTLAETICELSRQHCRKGGLILGQNLEAVQNVCGTVPVEESGVTIMPTCEAAGIGISIGAALSGKPVIHVIRFASFLWLQASPIVYYAARAKSIWGYDLPLFIRVSSDDGIGPTHSGAYHSPFVHMPGLKVVAPMTPGEYNETWNDFLATKQPVLVSEQRCAYSNSAEMPTTANSKDIDIVIIAVSAARFAAVEALPLLAQKNIGAEVRHVWKLTQAGADLMGLVGSAWKARKILIVDSSYEPCSFAEHLANVLHSAYVKEDVQIKVLGMSSPPGVGKNGSPSASRIADVAASMIEY